MKTLIYNIGCLATAKGNKAKSGDSQREIDLIENAWIAIDDDKIAKVGSGKCDYEYDCAIDADERLVTPGLIDPHTHLVFGGWREHELSLKLRGVPYLEILKNGGGILSTVKNTRQRSEDELIAQAFEAVTEMLSYGTTTCEAKSGYGLERECEFKQLRVAESLDRLQPVDIVSTFMAAHAVPEEYKGREDEYVDYVISMLPEVAGSGLAEFCDVFCETGTFTAEQSERILRRAQELGLKAKIHADEIYPIGGSELAGRIGAISAEHLIECQPSGIKAMAEGGTVAVLLPATSFYLDKKPAPARDFINAGVPVAIATDFNPGSTPNLNIQLTMNIACYKYRMLPEEVLMASTLNAACAINRADRIGTIEEGKQADILIWNADNLDMLFYRYGSNMIHSVIKNGVVAYSKQ